jgi:hypothetical protein
MPQLPLEEILARNYGKIRMNTTATATSTTAIAPARIAVQLDNPPRAGARILVERFHSCPQDAACELEGVDSAEVRNLAET